MLGIVHNCDCIEGMQQIDSNSIDLVFADPPFNIGYKYDKYNDSIATEEYLQWCTAWMQQVHRCLKATGTFWLAIGDDYAAELKIEAQKLGFVCRNWVIWYYTFGVNCKFKFTRSHTHLFYFIKDAKNFTFNAADIAIPSARQLVYGDKRANPNGRLPDDTWVLRPQDLETGFSSEEDTWYFPRVAGTFKERAGFHGCQMPEQLLGRIIRGCSNIGETVMDPFAGSSTTMIVAKKLDRQLVGFELSEDYAKLGNQRIKKTSIGDRLLGAEEPRISAPKTDSQIAKNRRDFAEKNKRFSLKKANKPGSLF